MGITLKARVRAVIYSYTLMCSKPKALDRKGIYMTAVVEIRLIKAEPHRNLLCPGSVKMLAFWLRMLKLWHISVMLRVRKAMVIPSGLLAISHTPASIKWPMKYAAKVSTVTTTPWKKISKPKPPENRLSSAGLGLRCMTPGSACSMPRAMAGKQSVIRFIHKRWTGLRMVKPRRVAKNMLRTSLRLELRRN